jgi:hypothetical protein
MSVCLFFLSCCHLVTIILETFPFLSLSFWGIERWELRDSLYQGGAGHYSSRCLRLGLGSPLNLHSDKDWWAWLLHPSPPLSPTLGSPSLSLNTPHFSIVFVILWLTMIAQLMMYREVWYMYMMCNDWNQDISISTTSDTCHHFLLKSIKIFSASYCGTEWTVIYSHPLCCSTLGQVTSIYLYFGSWDTALSSPMLPASGLSIPLTPSVS